MTLWALVSLSAADDASDSVQLIWDANPEAGIAGYDVRYGTTSGELTQNLTVFGTLPEATLTQLAPGVRYFCAVRAFTASQLAGPLSSEISFVVSPPDLTLHPEISVEQASGIVLTDGPGVIDLGSVGLGSTGAAATFIIRNLGNADLTGLAITADGEELVVAAPGTSTLAPGEATSFKVAFRPAAAGASAASIRIASNDEDETPFDIAVVGTGVIEPEISVHASGVQVAAIDFGGIELGATSAAQTLTISNSGAATLTDMALVVDDGQVSDFLVTAPAVTSLAPGESTTFVVIFRPSAEGDLGALLHLHSNDPDEDPLDVQLTGVGVAVPAIAIPAITVTGPNNTPLATAAEVQNFGGIYLATTGEPRTFTIRNSGTADLTGLAITTDGDGAADFIVSAPGVTALVPGASATFQVAFQPSTAGARSAALHIASNAPGMDSFDIPLSGSGIAIPILALENVDGTPVEPAAIARFGGHIIGSTGSTLTYVVRNTGTAELTGIQIATTGLRASSYQLDLPSGDSLEPGASMSFKVTFKPAGIGSQPAAIRVTSNSALADAFKIALDGTGIAVPEIKIYQDDGTALTSGNGIVGFGNGHLGSTNPARIFTIKNLGTAKLSGLSVASDGADFNVGSLGATSLAPGASTTFKVAFQPKAAGTRGAHLVVTSNDADQRSFLIALTGKGIEVPEIVVELSGGKNLTDDDAFINFGSEDVGSTSKSLVFTIRNTGTARLDGLGIIKNGISPSEFGVSALKTRSLAPGASTTFRVNFSPARSAIRWAAIHIASNDADESYFDIVLTGTGKRSSSSAPPPPGLVGGTTVPATAPVKSIEVIGGRKYLMLTIAKTPGTTVVPRDIEVSPDLVAWSSGRRHTTVLLDNAKTLKVRDNTPVTPEAKRYIRLKP